jgi:hypothetical protein
MVVRSAMQRYPVSDAAVKTPLSVSDAAVSGQRCSGEKSRNSHGIVEKSYFLALSIEVLEGKRIKLSSRAWTFTA